jgi:hypothetical protein
MEERRGRRSRLNPPEVPASQALRSDATTWRATLAVLPARDSIYYMAYFDGLLANFCLEPEMPKEQRQQTMEQLAGHITAYNAALPFYEAERRWVRSMAAQTELEPGDDRYAVEGAYEPLLDAEAQIVSGGLRQVVRGRELVQRWVSWRRQTGEFAVQTEFDQSSYKIARAELRNIAICLQTGQD